MHKFLVLNGPNLNLLGAREPELYGKTTLNDINNNLNKLAELNQIEIECFQSNSEGELINKTQTALNNFDFMIINPAGLTHTSIAWRDAILATGKPFIEVHLSNIYSRETFRHNSYFSDIAIGVISGLGAHSYELAILYALNNY
jgi:3-dehydroquinate dehydratase II